jgi:hypothetical protein
MPFKLFSNSGIQLIYIPLPDDAKLMATISAKGWQFCRLQREDQTIETLHYAQWQLAPSNKALLLAIDTSLGGERTIDLKSGKDVITSLDPLATMPNVFIHGGSGLAERHFFSLAGLVDNNDQIIHLQDRHNEKQELPLPQFCLLAPGEVGDSKEVHLVVDFGNSRTGALLLELEGGTNPKTNMTPFTLLNRYRMDAWSTSSTSGSDAPDEEAWSQGRLNPNSTACWFSSRTCWTTPPYMPPTRVEKQVEDPNYEPKRGLRGQKGPGSFQATFQPRVFDDLSLVRMGAEAEDMLRMIHSDGDKRTGVSSPKRYLWADDDRWLNKAKWSMADAYDRIQQTPGSEQANREHSATLFGQLLKFIDEKDSDHLLEVWENCKTDEELMDKLKPFAAREPMFSVPPRALMVAALYEIMCQAYTFANSIYYRRDTGEEGRPRRIASMALSYPSGMVQPERERFLKQAQKAALIFHRTLGKHEKLPEVSLTIDEASAVHLTYLWSELQSVGLDAELWFSTNSRRQSEDPALYGQPPEESKSEEPIPEPDDPSVNRFLDPSEVETEKPPPEPDPTTLRKDKEVRIACIDIGGGTTDIMIARYWCVSRETDTVHGEMLHRDGISIAGDQLVKRLLEHIIVPRLASVSGLDKEAVSAYFGPEGKANMGFRRERIDWMNRLLVPLAHAYLQRAVEEDTQTPISHTNPDLVEEDVLEKLERVRDKLEKTGQYNFREDLGLKYDPRQLDKVIDIVFKRLLTDYCDVIVEHDTDIVLLAGQPSKLKQIHRMVSRFLPLHDSRVIPMQGYYAFPKYPYADSEGIIADPKSAVVVGTAAHFLASKHKLYKLKLHTEPKLIEYYWGIMNLDNLQVPQRSVLFTPTGSNTYRLKIEEPKLAIGRRVSNDHESEAAPVYVLEVDVPERGVPEIEVEVQLCKLQHNKEELLEIDRIQGKINGQPATSENVHLRLDTLADASYFLDTGELHNIKIS